MLNRSGFHMSSIRQKVAIRELVGVEAFNVAIYYSGQVSRLRQGGWPKEATVEL